MKDFRKTVFPEKDAIIRLAMIGMIPGNGHPYSWSAILNGFNKKELEKCPYPVIPQYMAQQGEQSTGLEGAEVTHVWTDVPADAHMVAAASRIGKILSRPEDAIGHVDAVVIATDDGDNHVTRARPFIEAGIPVFIDKPLATNFEDLRWFIEKERAGHFIMSCSGLRFAPELESIRSRLPEIGELRWLSCVTIKQWENYGIHALESVYQITGPGFETIMMEAHDNRAIAHLTHEKGFTVTIPVLRDAGGSFGGMMVCGTKGKQCIQMKDTYHAFRDQLKCFIKAIRSGEEEINFSETVDMMNILIAGRKALMLPGSVVRV